VCCVGLLVLSVRVGYCSSDVTSSIRAGGLFFRDFSLLETLRNCVCLSRCQEHQ